MTVVAECARANPSGRPDPFRASGRADASGVTRKDRTSSPAPSVGASSRSFLSDEQKQAARP